MVSAASGILVCGVSTPPGWDVSPLQGSSPLYSLIPIYTLGSRGSVRVQCLAQEHNAMISPSTRTPTAQSGTQLTNHYYNKKSPVAHKHYKNYLPHLQP